jgi:hypothetical protein
VMFCLGTSLFAQKIVYSEPEREDTRRLVFEVAGKIGGNFLIYKNLRNKNWIAVLDNDMKQISSSELDFVPDNDRMINVDFFPFPDFCYMIYQYQKKNVVYCMAAKLDGSGKKLGDVMELDTSHIGFATGNRIYTVINSEDKTRIGVFKINSRNKKVFIMTTILLNDKLEQMKRSRLYIPMEDRYDYLNDFHLDNDGDLVFAKFYRNSNDNISKASFVVKPALEDTLRYTNLQIDKTYLDEIHIKVDNFNKRYLLTSFYYKQRRGNIDGFYFYIWDKTSGKPVVEDTTIFTEELRLEAKGDNSMKSAFNDYFIRNIVPRRDGGFLLGSESYYTTSRFNSWSRWDYLYGSSYMSPMDNYYYSPYYNNYWWNSRSSNQAVRYHSDNIAVLSFDKNAQLEWSSVIGKEQFDDQSDDLLSYHMMNTGGSLHFLFNKDEKRNLLLNDYSLTPAGNLTRNPTLKNLDKGYEFMPKYAKQVSARQMIVPCQYRNYICFAKIDYN